MTKRTFHCNGNSLPDYPDNLPIQDVHVYIHDSLMAVKHNYPCPVCLKNHAVYNMNDGIFKPCWGCQKDGYALVKKGKAGWFKSLFN